MKKKTISLFAALVLAGSSYGQTTITETGNSRFIFNSDSNGFPGGVTNAANNAGQDGNGQFGGDTTIAGDVFVQFIQFDLTDVGDQAAFNAATSFEISFLDTPAQSFQAYIANSSTFGANFDMLSSSSSFLGGAIMDIITTRGTDLGSFTGDATIASSAGLDSLLGGADFGTNNRVYLVLTPNGTSGTEFGVRFDGTTLTAVPEPSSYALVSGALALGLISMRRRR